MTPAAAYRSEGARWLVKARALAVRAKPGPRLAGDARPARPHDRKKELRIALRRARYWFTCASRLVLVRRAGIESECV